MVVVGGALGVCCASGAALGLLLARLLAAAALRFAEMLVPMHTLPCACLVQVLFLLCVQADKAGTAASAAVADAANNEEDMDAYSDYDETPAEVSQAGSTKGLSAKSGKRPMEGATPGNQIGAAKRAKRNRP